MEMVEENERAGVDHLAGERANAQFDLHSMKIYFAGGEHEYAVATKVGDMVAKDPVWASLTGYLARGNVALLIAVKHWKSIYSFQ